MFTPLPFLFPLANRGRNIEVGLDTTTYPLLSMPCNLYMDDLVSYILICKKMAVELKADQANYP